jgi:hypothetical protein
MALNSEGNFLRETNNPPLTNVAAPLSGAQHDANVINMYNDLVTLSTGGSVDAYNPLTSYDDTNNKYVLYGGFIWMYIFATPAIGVTPVEGTHWTQVPPSVLAHVRNKDSKLDEGGADEVSAAEIKAVLTGVASGQVIYKGRIHQTGTNAPVLEDYINPTSLTLTPSYGITGFYSIQGFTGETFITAGNYQIELSLTGLDDTKHVEITPLNETVIALTTKVSGVATDGVLLDTDGGGQREYQVLTITKY